MRFSALCMLLLIASTTSPSFAGDYPSMKINTRDFSEIIFEDMLISDVDSIVGFQTGQLTYKPVKMGVWVAGIRATDRYLCFRFAHVSGAYEARGVIPASRTTDWAYFEMPSRAFRRLDVRAGEMATKVFTSERRDCRSPTEHLLVQWERPGPQYIPASVHALVNVSETAISRVVDHISSEEADCQSIRTLQGIPQRLAHRYSHVCSLHLRGTENGRADVNLVVETTRARQIAGQLALRLPEELKSKGNLEP